MGNRNVTIVLATAIPGTKTANEAFLRGEEPVVDTPYEPDISESLGQVVTVHIAIDDTADSIIEYTMDGVKYHSFLNGVALKKLSSIERQITLRFGDKLNFRAKTTIGLDYLYLDLV